MILTIKGKRSATNVTCNCVVPRSEDLFVRFSIVNLISRSITALHRLISLLNVIRSPVWRVENIQTRNLGRAQKLVKYIIEPRNFSRRRMRTVQSARRTDARAHLLSCRQFAARLFRSLVPFEIGGEASRSCRERARSDTHLLRPLRPIVLFSRPRRSSRSGFRQSARPSYTTRTNRTSEASIATVRNSSVNKKDSTLTDPNMIVFLS